MSAKVNHVENLEKLKAAADSYFQKQEQYINNEYAFLDAISRARGGATGMQDANAEGCTAILVGSLDDYLGRPIGEA